MGKKALCLIFAFLLSINSFAAVVSDNDGAAFITKAEFEALKKNFSNQIDNYNNSIDNKIDGAIAAYLAGTRLSKEEKLQLDPKCMYRFPMVLDHLNRWADADSRYYNVSSPKIERRAYQMVYWEDQNFPTINITVDPSNVTSYTVNKMPSSVDWHYSNSTSLAEIVHSTVGIDGFLSSVSLINGQRTIGGSTYGTRERLTAGYGFDVATYVGEVISPSGGAHYMSNNSADINRKYQYYQIYGLPPGNGSSSATSTYYNWSSTANREHTFTPTWLVATRYGNGGTDNAYPISAMGNTYQSFFNHKTTKIPAGWVTDQAGYVGSPYSNVFNWTDGGVVDHIYAFNGNMPAEKLGAWDLRVDKDTNNNSKYRKLSFNNNSDLYIIGYTGIQTGNMYGNAWMAYCYDIEPFWVPSTNTNTMPGDSETFSQLPASLVYYYDSNNKKHFCDEGLFLQTIERDGKVKLTLKFSGDSGVVIRVIFSKKPFDNAWATTDELTFKVGNNEYKEYDVKPSENQSVSLEIENLLKGDDLYMFWWAQTSTQYCQLDEIESFTFIEDN